ncbi:MAG: hypothetical protein L3J33_07295 [Rhodobacteraceae bacterium]|nr:hypothetical protein [Paracoccaceae bacterium]
MTPDQIRILLGLAEQKKTRDMAELTQKQREIRQADQVISSLENQVDTTSQNIKATDLATTARWLGWAGQEKSRLLQARKTIENAAESARKIAAHSDAKTRVIDDLLAKAEKHELLEDRRRAERMGREPDK